MTNNKNPIIIIIIILTLISAGIWMFLNSTVSSGSMQDPYMIAVSSSGPDINSPISEFVGRAPYYIVYHLQKRTFLTVSNPYVNEAHAVGLRAAALLKAKGAGIVICKNIGPEPSKKFNEYRIAVYMGASGTVSDGIRQYKSNQLILTTKPNVPTHFGLPGQKPCPNVLGQPKTRIDNPMNPVPADAGIAVKQVAQQSYGPQNNVMPEINNYRQLKFMR